MTIDAFRIANESDASAISKLVNAAYRPGSGTSSWTHESELVAGERTNPTQVAEIISKPNSAVIVGINNSEIIACVHIEKEGSSCHIGMLAVNPMLQGSGAGKQILAQAEKHAIEVFNSEKFVIIVVSSRGELISFYMRRGYQNTGTVIDYPLSAGAGIPKSSDLKVEVLEKRSNIAVRRDGREAARLLP